MLKELTHFSPFRDLGAADLKIIAPLFSARTYPAGAIVIEQGERATCLYLLTQGEVMIRYKPYDGEAINLNRLKAGSVFGWSAALGNPVYSASVVCNTDCEVLIICGKDLHQLQASHPQTGRVVLDRLAQSVSARRANANAQVKAIINKGVNENQPPLAQEGESNMATPPVASPKEEQLRLLLENISAYIEHFHGGSVEFVSFDGVTVKVKLGGACLGCPLSPSTLHGWVEGTVHQFFPEVQVEPA